MTSIEAIENLYKIFNKYQLQGNLEKCACGCISDEEERKIYSKDLRQLEAEDLAFYNHKAMTTWGDLNGYKHFVPRLFEVYSNDNYGLIDLWTIHNKLNHGNWKVWKNEEQQAITDFVKADWNFLVNEEIYNLDFNDFEERINYLEIKELLQEWKFTNNEIALQNFVNFYYENGYNIIYNLKKIKINKNDYSKLFYDLIKRDNLKAFMETVFFKQTNIDKDYADKISVVLQMIEDVL